MSFTFGSPAGQPAANSTGFGFGAPKTNATGAAPGLGGGGGAANTSFSFGGTPAAAGTTTNAPAPATNFSFGSPAAAAPTQPQLSFGQPAAAAPTFGLGGGGGTTATATPTFGLGGASTAGPALGLGTSTSAPSLGAAAAAAVPTFGLGGTGTTAPAPTFGQASTAAPPTFGLGGTTAQTSTAAAPTFGLGGAAAQQTAPAAAAPTFGGLGGTAAQATPAPTFGLGGTTAQPTTAAAAPTFGLGGSTLATGGLFGKQAATTTQAQQPAAGLNFGTTTTSASLSLGASGGLFGKTAGAAGQAPAANTTAPFVGLGGIDVSATQPKAGTSKQDIKVKETIVPDEIAKTVDALKNYIKAQKQMASDIGRVSTSKLTKVSMEIARVKTAIQNISNSVEANYATTQMLRLETSKANHTVDMAQRTQDTPPGLQFENNAPFLYFQNLVNNYEKELLSMKEHIGLTEHHMRSLTNPQNVTPEDLKRCFQQINESFISLAGRLHEIHQKVEVQKEQYLNLRKYRLQDSTDVFSNIDKPTAKPNTAHLTGRTPFTNVSAISGLNKMYSNLSSSGGAGNATNVSSQTGN